MKKALLCLLGIAVLFAAVPTASYALSQPLEGTLRDTGQLTNKVYLRYYTPASTKINPNGGNACPVRPMDGEFCEMTYRASTLLYRGYSENTFNFDGAAGNTYYQVIDAQTIGANHVGYYAWLAKVVNDADAGNATNADKTCAGTTDISCLGPAVATDADDYKVPSTPQGELANVGGLRPIPVPRVGGYDKNTGAISLNWIAAAPFNDTAVAKYQLFSNVQDPIPAGCGGTANPCDCPDVAETGYGAATLPESTGTTAVINVSQLGLGLADRKCVTFALKIRYPDAGGAPVYSRYLSANGQSVITGQGGFLAIITSLEAKLVGGQGIAVNWTTGVEDENVQSFKVLRAFTVNGQFTEVGSVDAKNTPSSYTFIDNQVPAGTTRASGVYYKIQVIDNANLQLQLTDAVKANLGGSQSTTAPRPQTRKDSRR